MRSGQRESNRERERAEKGRKAEKDRNETYRVTAREEEIDKEGVCV